MAPEQSGEWNVRLASSLAVKSDSCPFSTAVKRLLMEGSLANPQSDVLTRVSSTLSVESVPSKACKSRVASVTA